MISVASDYVHIRKRLSSGERLSLPGVGFKWYDLHAEDREIPEAVRKEARDFVADHLAEITPVGELGFVILHRVGDAYLLLVCTWRNENELWETVYGKAEGAFGLLRFDETHKGTYCVWELGAVLHEQQAWIRYLLSARDDAARQAYLADLAPTALI